MNKLDLDAIRTRINTIDAQLAQLFEERMQVVAQVAAYKKEHNLPVRDSKREQEVLEQAGDRIQDTALRVAWQRIMRQIIETAVANEHSLMSAEETQNKAAQANQTAPQTGVVAYQGVPGAYSHLALEQHFGSQQKCVAYAVFEDVVRAVKDGAVSYGVLPIENSSTGGITEVYDLVRRYDVSIVGEEIVKVEHNLLAYPGTKLEEVREVYSHPQGFAQCRSFFKKYPLMKQIPYFNTAKGAEYVAEHHTNYMAAVAGRQAAERYGLAILAAHINSNANNYTRFIIIGSQAEFDAAADKITLVVSLRHEPGSLYKLLGYFEEEGLNLTNIESRPLEGRSWEYFFHLDVKGNLQDVLVQKALRQVEDNTIECKILGNYRSAQ